MPKLANRAKMTTATTGTGTITLGSASAGFQTFANAGIANGDVIRYVIEDGNNWEIGSGTYTSSGTTLSRTVAESSNADAAINLSGSAAAPVTICPCCVQGPQCCCDEAGPRVLAAGEECTGSTFPVPDPAPDITLVFEWCGMTAERVPQGGEDSFFVDQNVDFKVCDTNGRYGEGVVSYTQANRKVLSVYIFPGRVGGGCGYKQNFVVGTSFEGTSFALFDGNPNALENVITVENYSCKLYQCYDGSEADVSMTTSNEGPDGFGFSLDDTCGAAGNFNPCKFTAPELTVVGAP